MDPSWSVVECRISDNVPPVPCPLQSSDPSFRVLFICLPIAASKKCLPDIISKAICHCENPQHDRINSEGRQAFVRQRLADIKNRSRLYTAYILSLAAIVERAHFFMQEIYPPIIMAECTFLPPAFPDVGQGRIGRGDRYGAGSLPEDVIPNTG